MPLFDKIINKIFPGGQEVTIHEVLKRSAHFIRDFEEWKRSESTQVLIDTVHNSYIDKLASREPEIDIEVYRSPYANGFIIYPTKTENELQLEFLMEYIKEMLEEEGYRLVHSDRRLRETGKSVTSIEKYYLKPPISHEIPIDQIYGNVIIELTLKNNLPFKFKVIVNVYSDRLYSEARNFEDLISFLFDKRSNG
jgi:hypothetical protein